MEAKVSISMSELCWKAQVGGGPYVHTTGMYRHCICIGPRPCLGLRRQTSVTKWMELKGLAWLPNGCREKHKNFRGGWEQKM